MAGTRVYSRFEVRDGFGPIEVGALDLVTDSRAEADARVQEKWDEGSCVQLFGIKADEGSRTSSRVLLRSLVARKAA
ncbi:MAG: hypothetical protein ACREQY_08785 [Candidatus Binatia bacterium]